jgi:hypothetical protein
MWAEILSGAPLFVWRLLADPGITRDPLHLRVGARRRNEALHVLDELLGRCELAGY